MTADAAPAEAPAMDYAAESESYYEMGEMYAPGADAGGMSAETRQQKIILEANLSMATERFDEVSRQIRETAVSWGGYVESSNQVIRYDGARVMDITLRVPSDSYEAVLTAVKSMGTLSEAFENQRNATAEYYDIQARLETKRIEEERLLDLIGRTESVEDILKLEEMLGDVRTQIEVYQTQMTSIDRLSSYSTVSIRLEEVADETAVVVPEGLGGRMYASFIKSVNSTVRFLQNVLIVLVGLSVPAFVALAAAAIIWALLRIRRAARRRKKKDD